MKIIVDTNILFSAMLSQNSHLRQTLNNQELEIFAPNYIFLELALFKHKEKLLKLSKQSEAEIYLFLNYLLERIKFISPDLISTQNYRLAYDTVKKWMKPTHLLSRCHWNLTQLFGQAIKD